MIPYTKGRLAITLMHNIYLHRVLWFYHNAHFVHNISFICSPQNLQSIFELIEHSFNNHNFMSRYLMSFDATTFLSITSHNMKITHRNIVSSSFHHNIILSHRQCTTTSYLYIIIASHHVNIVSSYLTSYSFDLITHFIP